MLSLILIKILALNSAGIDQNSMFYSWVNGEPKRYAAPGILERTVEEIAQVRGDHLTIEAS